MSVFTNAAASSQEQAAAYVAAILELLAGRDPLAIMAATPDLLGQGIAGLTPEQLVQPEAPGKWSIRHVLQHLADSEVVCGWRIRLVLAHDRPTVTGYDQDLWAARLAYDDVDPQQGLRDFAAARDANLRLLRRVPPARLENVGVHTERGEESVAHMMRLYAGHDLLHIRQIERIRAAVS
jgi:uncharacterized damage-inducible protein DinB